MALLDNSNDKNAELLLKVSEPLVRIADDDRMEEAITGLKGLANKSEFRQKMGLLKFVPVILRYHKDDLYEMIAAVQERTVKEVAQQSTRDTITAVQAILQDEDIRSFFSSTSQPENTEKK